MFRAEKSRTHRHLCEFTGLDFEMVIKEHYYEVCALTMFTMVIEYIPYSRSLAGHAVCLVSAVFGPCLFPTSNTLSLRVHK